MSATASERLKCSRCGAEAPSTDAFAVDRSKPTGRKSVCKACDAERCRRYYERNRVQRLAAQNERNARLRARRPRRMCARCDVVPAATSRHRYCDACRQAVAEERETKPYGRNLRTCEACGDTYRPHRHDQRACSRYCGLWVRFGRWPSVALPWRQCAQCERSFIARQGAICCSAECQHERDRAAQRRHYWEKLRPGKLVPIARCKCRECGLVFVPGRPPGQGMRRVTFCSEACSSRFAHRQRRHRKRTNGPSERFSLTEIAERDGWRCHLCGERVTRATWSLDHLVPVSCGGTHTRTNVALAHCICNSRRGASGAAQLLLVG
jgi:hypothetical protein